MTPNAHIEGYRNRTGDHCGSVAMRNLLFHYCNLDLLEATVFGLGSGVDLLHWEMKGKDPNLTIFGRSLTMEADLASALGIDYREQFQPDNPKAWEDVRAEVKAGRPTMLSGDIFYLDYRKFKVHFPLHRFVLLGYDDETGKAEIADRVSEHTEFCSYEALALSRNAPIGFSSVNLWGKFYDTQRKREIPEACRIALKKSVDRMLGRDESQISFIKMVIGPRGTRFAAGLAGIEALGETFLRWPESEKGAGLAADAAQTFEKYGTGGGNFRKLYAAYLRWALEIAPDLVDQAICESVDRSAQGWTRLAADLTECAEKDFPPEATRRVSDGIAEILQAETELFERLDEKTA